MKSVPSFSLRDICSSSNSEINSFIDKFNDSTDFLVQQDCIKFFGRFLTEHSGIDDRKCVMKLLAFVYASCTAKHPVKKSLTRILLPIEGNELLTKTFAEVILHRLTLLLNESDEALFFVKMDHFFNSLCNSFELKAVILSLSDNLDILFNFAVEFLQELIDLWKRNVVPDVQKHLIYIHNSTKFLLCLSQKCNISRCSWKDKMKLIRLLYEVLIHREISFEVKSNSGHLMVIIFSTMSSEATCNNAFKDHLYLNFLQFEEENTKFFETYDLQRIQDPSVFEMFWICIYIGITIVVPADILYTQQLDNKSIFTFMLQKLTHSGTRAQKNIQQMLGVSKAVTLLSSHLQYIKHVDDMEMKTILNRCLEYVNVYSDNVPDIIKNNSLLILKNVIKTAQTFKSKENNFIKVILEWFYNLSGSSNYYTIMVVLSLEISCTTILKENSDLAKQMLNDILLPSKAAHVRNSFEQLMKIHRKEVSSKEEWINYWVTEIVTHLQKSHKEQALFTELFVSAFKIESSALAVLSTKPYLESDFELLALLGCIYYTRKNGLTITAPHYLRDLNNCWRNLLDFGMLITFQTHINDEIRILSLAIIVDSHSSTEIFTEWELEYLVNYFYYNINVPNVNVRQKLLSFAKKALQRINSTTTNLQNKLANNRMKLLESFRISADHTLNCYNKFWQSLFQKVLLPGLCPDSNYLRKSTALEILNLTTTILPELGFEKFFCDYDIENLKYILERDTYEHNKEIATKLLIEFPFASLGFYKKEDVILFIDKCLTLALNIKPILTVSAAYMLRICLRTPYVQDAILEKLKTTSDFSVNVISKELNNLMDSSYLLLLLLDVELNGCLKVAEENIHKAAASKPIHGLIFCIRHILKSQNLMEEVKASHWKMLIENIITICLKLTVVTNTIVCNESPEGYLPENFDSQGNDIDETAKAQMITVYGWRATKEISLLFGEISLSAPFSTEENVYGLINKEQLLIIGNYFFNLLINTKHRGAFEQASVGFSNLCLRLWRLMESDINTLPVQWLNNISSMVLGTQSEDIKSCETRRSAGVPFLAQAILSTEPVAVSGSHNFHSFMEILLNVSNNDVLSPEQRILALNILKVLYRHHQLGEIVAPYCAQGLMVAIKGFGCTIWGIRNSAAQLFSSIVIRIFGVPRLHNTLEVSIKNKMQGQVFFVRYPDLFPFLLQELEMALQDTYRSSLYPVLVILSRLYCNKETLDSSQLDSFLPGIGLCLMNPSFKIRELAAQTMTTIIPLSRIPNMISKCITALSNISIPDNYCHGLLLELKYLLRLQQSTPTVVNPENIVDATLWILLVAGVEIHWATATTYLEILLYLFTKFDPELRNINIFYSIISLLLWYEETEQLCFEVSYMKSFNEYAFTLKLMYILYVKNNYSDSCTTEIFKSFFKGGLRKYSGALNLCICYINYIKFTKPYFTEYRLFQKNNYEYFQLCGEFLGPLKFDDKVFLYDFLFTLLLEAIEDNADAHCDVIDTLLLHNLSDFRKECIEKYLNNNRQKVKYRYEDYQCMQIAYIDKLLQNSQMRTSNFEKYVNILHKFSSPNINHRIKLALTTLFIHNKKLFYYAQDVANICHVYRMWEIVFILIEDEDEAVRNAMCILHQENLTNKSLNFMPMAKINNPERTREILLNQMTFVLQRTNSIKMLLTLVFRMNPEANDNLSEIFVEGVVNTYFEFWPMAKAATYELGCLLKRSENKTDLKKVTEELYNTLTHETFPLISSIVKSVLCQVFQSIISEDYDGDACVQLNGILKDKSCKLNISEAFRLRMFFSSLCNLNFDTK